MNEILTLNLSDLETLLSKGYCTCHFINPNKTRIILWKEIKEDGSETYYLRIGIQKFVSYPLTDKNQAQYWRFNGFETKLSETQTKFAEQQVKTEETINLDPNDSVTKYQKRVAQAQAINHGRNNSNSNSS